MSTDSLAEDNPVPVSAVPVDACAGAVGELFVVADDATVFAAPAVSCVVVVAAVAAVVVVDILLRECQAH